MQVTIDLEQVATAATGWFGENPFRLLIVYAALTAPFGIRLARSIIKSIYDDEKHGRRRWDFSNQFILFAAAPVVAATGWASFPFYATWRILRAGLGPVPKSPG